MPKKLPKAAKERALKLYLTDEFSAKEIAEQVSAEQRVVMSEQTIYAWIRIDDWKEKKAQTQAKAMEKMQDRGALNIAKLTEQHFDLYGSIKDKAMNELQGLEFERAFDAVKAAEVGLQGQRETAKGLVSLTFVQDLIQILVDEIEDQDIVNRIAVKLKAKMGEHESEG
jgi:predicted DNA-binding protein YlxM (UPF0122 family)|tara:strand:- start:322 stop:828 length:507 start_codon:yes stop_codon:yes gene_type:complete